MFENETIGSLWMVPPVDFITEEGLARTSGGMSLEYHSRGITCMRMEKD